MAHTPETRAKISAACKGLKLGIPLSLAHRLKMSEAKKGERNSRWKGGITAADALVRASGAQLQWARDVKARDDYTCQNCGKRGGTLHSHHINSFAQFPSLRTELSNGITLCKPCHNEVHST